MYRDTSCNPRGSWSGQSAQQDEQEVLSSFLLEVLSSVLQSHWSDQSAVKLDLCDELDL